MKPLIVGTALIILILFMIVFQSDTYNARLEAEFLKYCADEASSSAALFYYKDKFIEGKKMYNEEQGIKAIEGAISHYLKTDNVLIPLKKSYWKDKITYIAYFFDDDLECTVYKDGKRINSFNFAYPYIYTDTDLKYIKSVGKANVIVTINAGRAKYRLNFVTDTIVIRSSGYEYEI